MSSGEITVRVNRTQAAMALPLPAYASELAAGVDLLASGKAVIEPGEWKAVGTGLHVEIPEGFEIQVRPRSGLALREGVTVLNAPGTIDADYRGEIRVILINHGKEPFEINAGDRIAQAVLAAVARLRWEETTDLSQTTRGEGGFGSTGK